MTAGRLVAPPRPRYVPFRCIAPKDPLTPGVRCNELARLYACGWRCDRHRPGATRSTTTNQEAA